MKPRGSLMIEHRLIEKMLGVIGEEAQRIEAGGIVDARFIDDAVDFIRFYADRTHHGKEEDILFRELEHKELSEEHAAAMAELVDEHKMARERVRLMVAAKERFQNGEPGAVGQIVALMQWLADFYPRHIRKEDASFFPDTEKYFSLAELDAMLAAFHDFDGKMIHEKYARLVERMRERAGRPDAGKA